MMTRVLGTCSNLKIRKVRERWKLDLRLSEALGMVYGIENEGCFDDTTIVFCFCKVMM